jgi:hypothetical protein
LIVFKLLCCWSISRETLSGKVSESTRPCSKYHPFGINISSAFIFFVLFFFLYKAKHKNSLAFVHYHQKVQIFWQKLIKFIWDEDSSNIQLQVGFISVVITLI